MPDQTPFDPATAAEAHAARPFASPHACRLERCERATAEFLSAMSHELRTPMNAVLGFAQLLSFDHSLNDEQRGNVTEILRAGRKLVALIDGLLEQARAESGRLVRASEPIERPQRLRERAGRMAAASKAPGAHDGAGGPQQRAVPAATSSNADSQ